MTEFKQCPAWVTFDNPLTTARQTPCDFSVAVESRRPWEPPGADVTEIVTRLACRYCGTERTREGR